MLNVFSKNKQNDLYIIMYMLAQDFFRNMFDEVEFVLMYVDFDVRLFDL